MLYYNHAEEIRESIKGKHLTPEEESRLLAILNRVTEGRVDKEEEKLIQCCLNVYQNIYKCVSRTSGLAAGESLDLSPFKLEF